jgi:hypothetical protein
MKKIFPMVLILILGCGEDEPPGQKVDRFLKSLNPASDVSTLESIVYFRRLLAADNEAASGMDYKDLIKPFGLNLNTRELLTLSADYSYPPLNYADTTEFPVISGEPVSIGIKSPDSGTFVFETTEKGPLGKSKIYLRQKDMLSQLTFGDVSCHLENFSSSGRYISALLGWDPSWILLFDLENEKNYKIESYRLHDQLFLR